MSASLRCFLSRYVLDPEGNLPSTRDALAPLFRRLEDRTRSGGGGEGKVLGVFGMVYDRGHHAYTHAPK